MRLQLVLATALLAISATSVQAADTRTPDILTSISAESFKTMSKTDVKNNRAQYFVYNSRDNQWNIVRLEEFHWLYPKGKITRVIFGGYDFNTMTWVSR